MKWIAFIMFLLLTKNPVLCQELTPDLMSSMVELVDSHIDLSDSQEKSLLEILENSYEQVQLIQKGNDVDVIKLQRMVTVQQDANQRLKKVLTEEQYKAYTALLNGTASNDISDQGIRTYADKVSQLAEDLQLKQEAKEQFKILLMELEAKTQLILEGNKGEVDVAPEILTEILKYDLDLLSLIGRNAYIAFFERRADGALTDGNARKTGSVEQVLVFHDLTRALELSGDQTRNVIRVMLENEARLYAIRSNRQDSPALIQEKIRVEQQQGLLRLQDVLTDDQVEKLLQLIRS
ncbi:MAG: hypothetical protein GY751_22135 [Bacteroidetes bacterium]|nr:hypothetical protein [Bacteroidota bacterium]